MGQRKICPCSNEPNPCGHCQTLAYERTLYKKLREERLAAGLCVDCGKNNAASDGTRCESCRLKANEYRAKKRKRYLEEGKCNNCGASPVSDSCRELCESCRLVGLARAREIAKQDKQRVMQHYGKGACCCCGEAIIEFLTIDHIEENGADHRKELFKSRDACGEKFYKWLINNNFPPGYQVLCFNCNNGKHLNGVCPHKSEVRAPDRYQQWYGYDLKCRAISAYGGCCKCCNETALPLLNIDHINGRNTGHEADKLRGDKLYRWLRRNNFPPGFQVLCFNCNVSKHLSGVCAHTEYAILAK